MTSRSDEPGVTCPTCRAAPGVACVGAAELHPARVLAAKAIAKNLPRRAAASTEDRATAAARKWQRDRARDPRMNNDW